MSRTYLARSIDDAWLELNGRIARHAGHTWIIRARTYKAKYPRAEWVMTLDLDATPATKRSEYYQKVKHELHDDWGIDLLHSEDAYLDVAEQFRRELGY